MSDVPAVKDIGDPLDDIGDLVEKTLSILNTATDANAFEAIGEAAETPTATPPSTAVTPFSAPTAAVSTSQDQASKQDDPLLDLLGPSSPPPPTQQQQHMDALDLLGPTTPASPPVMVEAPEALPTESTLSPVAQIQSQDLDLLSVETTTSVAQHQINLDGALSSQFEEQSLADPEPATPQEQPAPENPLEEEAAVSPVPSPSMPALPPVLSEISVDAQRPPALRPPSISGAGSTDSSVQQGVRVWVKDPEKVETATALGIKSHYVTYLVRTESSLPSMRADGLEVRRRFSDFDMLHKMLKRTHRGFFVPPLPEKSFIEGKIARNDFVRLRRADLQAFLRACAAHPVLHESEPMKLFLLQQGDLSRNPAWLQLVEMMQQPVAARPRAGSSESGPEPGGLGGLLGMNASWLTWVRQTVFTPPTREPSEEEKELMVAKELLQDLERLLELACNSARTTCQHFDQVSGDLHEFGRTLAMLSRFEEAVRQRSGQYTEQGFSAAKRAEDLQKVAMCNGRQSSLWKALSIKSAASLVTLHDYYVLVPEAVAALEEREKALEQVTLLEDDLLYRQHQMEQLQGATKQGKGSVSAVEKKSYQLQQQIAQLEESIRLAKEQYEVIKLRNRQELTRFGLDREADFRHMLHAFATQQAQHVQAQADMWASLVKQLEGREDATPVAQ